MQLQDGVPDASHPSVQQFFQAREQLISKESVHRSDYKFRQSLSPVAKRACSIVSQIRKKEQDSIWSTTADPSLNPTELFPGMMFNMAKTHMETTKLWRIIQKMPKGTLLHCHLGAMVDLEWVFTEALKTPGMCFSSNGPLVNDEVRESGLVEFCFSKRGVEGGNIWEDSYQPGTLIPVTVAADSYPNGGRKGFVAWMKDRCSITQQESIQHHLGVDDVWRKLNSAFAILPRIVYYEPILRSFLRHFFTTLLEDGVRWVEIRVAPFTKFNLEGQEEPTTDQGDFMKIVQDVVEKFKSSVEGKGFWGVRLIWSSIRFWDDRRLIQDMQDCLRLKAQYPDLISGYDLVGHEDSGRTLSSMAPCIVWFKSQCRSLNLDIPFFFHAGECVGSGNHTDHNLFDAVLFGTRRMGHGFSLYKHPTLIDEVKKKEILIESCPISNEVLRYTASIMSHPLPALLARGVKAALANDDPALLGQGTSGVTHDFWQALQGWDNLGLEGLGSLAQNSVRWAAFKDETDEEWIKNIRDGENGTGVKAEYIKEWNIEWEVFCKWVVDEFGDEN
ncbi:cat eye syndrome critical region protein [Halenospora varia]|nr:cat eye syndrome critical region protein [Halenospora varia]